VIPAAGVAAGGLAAAAGHVQPLPLASAALAGAGIAAAIRAQCGEAPAALAAAVLAPLVGVALLIDHLAAPALAIAAAAWTLAELARPPWGAVRPPAPPTPLVAVLPAAVATVLVPPFVVLLPVAASRLRGRARLPAQIAGVLACAAVVLYAGPPAHVDAPALARELADSLGPLLAVAALAGCALVGRARVDLVACVLAVLLGDVHAGSVGPATLGLAALCAGLAIARFAATIRLGAGQAIVAATCNALLLLAPAWLAVVR